MIMQATARVALSPLPVNTFGTPSTKNLSTKELLSTKRPIEEVEDVETPSHGRRRCQPQPGSENHLLVTTRAQPEEVRPGSGHFLLTATRARPEEPTKESTPSAASSPAPPDTQPSVAALMEVDASLNSPQGSTGSSAPDYDPDDTMESQQTAATEVTQYIQPRASQHLETLRLRLRLARYKVQTNQTNIPFAQLRLSTASMSPKTRPELDGHAAPDMGEANLPGHVSRLDFAHTNDGNTKQGEGASSSGTGRLTKADINEEDSTILYSAACESSTILEHYHTANIQTPELPRHQRSVKAPNTNDLPLISYQRGVGKEEHEKLTSSAVRGKAAVSLLGLRGRD